MGIEGLADAEIARRIGSGGPDAGAETELCRRFAHRIRLYGLRHLRDEPTADDLVQQVLVLVIESLRNGRVRELERLGSFVLGSCRMIARDLRRGESRRQALLDRYGIPSEATADPTPWLARDLERLRACLEKLPTRERTVVVLTFYGDYDGGEIARELAMSEGNIRVVRHRAVGHLQECMGGAEERS